MGWQPRDKRRGGASSNTPLLLLPLSTTKGRAAQVAQVEQPEKGKAIARPPGWDGLKNNQ